MIYSGNIVSLKDLPASKAVCITTKPVRELLPYSTSVIERTGYELLARIARMRVYRFCRVRHSKTRNIIGYRVFYDGTHFKTITPEMFRRHFRLVGKKWRKKTK